MTQTERITESITMYDVKSHKAEEFIDDSEIRETLAYAEQNILQYL